MRCLGLDSIDSHCQKSWNEYLSPEGRNAVQLLEAGVAQSVCFHAGCVSPMKLNWNLTSIFQAQYLFNFFNNLNQDQTFAVFASNILNGAWNLCSIDFMWSKSCSEYMPIYTLQSFGGDLEFA